MPHGGVGPADQARPAGRPRGPRAAEAAGLAEGRAHLRRADPVLARLIDAQPDFRPRAWLAELPPLDAFGTLVFQVVGQQLSIRATRRILQRLQERFAGDVPSPQQWLAASEADLLAAGLSRRKVATLRRVAEAFAAGRLSGAGLASLGDAGVEAVLTAIPGIGPWTVHGFLIIALGREDVVLPGDLALRRIIGRLYGLDHLPSADEVLAIAEPWRPHRSLATAYLFQAAFEPPPR